MAPRGTVLSVESGTGPPVRSVRRVRSTAEPYRMARCHTASWITGSSTSPRSPRGSSTAICGGGAVSAWSVTTVAFSGVYVDEGNSYPGMSLAFTEPAPAGTPIADRIFSVVLADTLTVSGPQRGASAEIYGADSDLITTVPLVDGAGSAPAPTQEPQFVRIIDAAGALVLAGAATQLAD